MVLCGQVVHVEMESGGEGTHGIKVMLLSWESEIG